MNEIKLNSKYKPLYNSDSDLIIITGGRGSAKSFTVSDWACRTTYQSNENILYTRYTLTSAKDSIIPEYKEKIELFNAEEHFKITEHEIVNKLNGSKIIFRGIKNSSGNQTANLKSIKNPTKWICDEASEIPDYNTFQKIRRSLRKKGAKIQTILVLNPESPDHWINQKFFVKYDIPDYFNGTKNGITYIHTTYLDNIDFLDEAFQNDAEKTKEENPIEYEHIFLGKWINYLERELFSSSSIQYYDNLTIDLKHATYLSFTDPSDSGDYFASIIVAIYNNIAYIVDVIFNKDKQGVNLQRLANKIIQYKCIDNTIEINKGGSILIDTLESLINNKMLELFGVHETINKEYRISVYSEYICKKTCFITQNNQTSEYKEFMNNLVTYNKSSKNDDAPDVLAALAKHMFTILEINL